MSHVPASTSQSALLRLARYHCLLEELLQADGAPTITSRGIAQQLGVTEESVRADLSHVDVKGRPGSGYDVEVLHGALARFLGLSDETPFVVVGNRSLLEALPIVFPAAEYGMRPVAYFSERESDVGVVIGDITIEPLSALASADLGAGNVTALVACDPGHVDEALASLRSVGVTGVLMLSPRIRPVHPEGMQVTYFRIPCALKSLAASSQAPAEPGAAAEGSCCGHGA